MAGGTAALVTNPLDVAKTRLQVKMAGKNCLLAIGFAKRRNGGKKFLICDCRFG